MLSLILPFSYRYVVFVLSLVQVNTVLCWHDFACVNYVLQNSVVFRSRNEIESKNEKQDPQYSDQRVACSTCANATVHFFLTYLPTDWLCHYHLVNDL